MASSIPLRVGTPSEASAPEVGRSTAILIVSPENGATGMVGGIVGFAATVVAVGPAAAVVAVGAPAAVVAVGAAAAALVAVGAATGVAVESAPQAARSILVTISMDVMAIPRLSRFINRTLLLNFVGCCFVARVTKVDIVPRELYSCT